MLYYAFSKINVLRQLGLKESANTITGLPNINANWSKKLTSK